MLRPPIFIRSGAPPTGRPNGRNYLTHAWVYADQPHAIAVLMEEVAEWRWRLKWLLIMWLPGALFAVLTAYPELVAVWWFVLCMGVLLLPGMKREIEIVGHAALIATKVEAYGGDQMVETFNSVHALRTAYPAFRSTDENEILTRLTKARPAAQAFLRQHYGFMVRWSWKLADARASAAT